jgi:pyridoxamine 5'-phosphate oxidase
MAAIAECHASAVPADPMPLLEAWLDELGDHSMVLATATPDGAPSARVVLLKAIRDGELVFGTTLASRKGRELTANPLVACVFHWSRDGRQARVSGRAKVCCAAETDALWRERGRDSRVVETVAREGEPLADPADLAAAFAEADASLGEAIDRPEDWAAVRVVPETVEFWTSHPRRLSLRELFVRGGDGAEAWTRTFLQP